MRHHRRPFQAVPARHSVVDRASLFILNFLIFIHFSTPFIVFSFLFLSFFFLSHSSIHLPQHRLGVTHGGLYHGRFSASSIFQEEWGVYSELFYTHGTGSSFWFGNGWLQQYGHLTTRPSQTSKQIRGGVAHRSTHSLEIRATLSHGQTVSRIMAHGLGVLAFCFFLSVLSFIFFLDLWQRSKGAILLYLRWI